MSWVQHLQCSSLALIHVGSKEYDLMNHELDPWTGSIQGVVQVVTSTFHGFAELFYSPVSVPRPGQLAQRITDALTGERAVRPHVELLCQSFQYPPRPVAGV